MTDDRYTYRAAFYPGGQQEGIRILTGLRLVDRPGWDHHVKLLGYNPNRTDPLLDRSRLIRFTLINDTPNDVYISYCWHEPCNDAFYSYRPIVAGDRLDRELVSVPGLVGLYELSIDVGSDPGVGPVGCVKLDQSLKPGSAKDIHLSTATSCN